jgi:1-acyl-sn-glycerol-3-phosphate acyltransferase
VRKAVVVDKPNAPTFAVPGRYSPVRFVLRPLLRAWLRLKVDRADHVPLSGPVLIASTHLSHGDSLAIAVATDRPVFFLGDLKLVATPVLGPLLPKLGMIPLRRGEADSDALNLIGAVLNDNGCIAVYPEGSRSRDGLVHRLRSGVARVASEHHVAVIPATVQGITTRWPIGKPPKLFGPPVKVRFGAPLYANDPSPKGRREFNMRLQQALADLAGVAIADGFSPPHGGEMGTP